MSPPFAVERSVRINLVVGKFRANDEVKMGSMSKAAIGGSPAE
jgi:hypothetical protein